MASKEFRKQVFEKQKELTDYAIKLWKEAAFEDRGMAKQWMTVQMNVLRQVQYKHAGDIPSGPPPKDIFKKKTLSPGETPATEDIKAIKNENVNSGAFKKKSVVDVPKEKKAIKNENVNANAFVKPDLPELEVEEKANPKRLSPEQTAAIKKLALEGLNKKQISDKLMIVEAKIARHLKSLSKGNGGKNLLATSANKGKDKFEKEIDDFKKGN